MKSRPERSAVRRTREGKPKLRESSADECDLDIRRSQGRFSGQGPAADAAGPDEPGATEPSLYEPLDFFMLRAPSQPVEAYRGLARQASAEAAPGSSAASLAPAKNLLAQCPPEVLRALVTGSPSLYAALERTTPSSTDARSVRGKLLRFLIRMSTRPTPFGLYAGVAMAQWGAVTDLSLGPSPRPRTRPDMGWLMDFVMRLESRPEIRRGLRVCAHQGLLVHAGRVTLADCEPTPEQAGGKTGRFTASVRATRVVRQALALARTPIAYEALVTRLHAACPGADLEGVEQVVGELLALTLLLTDLRPPLTLADPARHVLEKLAGIPAAAEAHAQLAALCAAAARWDLLPAEQAGAPFLEMMECARAIAGKAAEPVFQVDAALTLRGKHLSRAVAEEVARAAQLLLRLAPFPQGITDIENYRRAFVARYSHGQEIPLLELLDPNLGMAFPPRPGAVPRPAQARSKNEVLLELACAALQERRLVVELDAKTIKRLETHHPAPDTVPAALDLFAWLAAPSTAAIDAGEFRVVVGPCAATPGACPSMGRFGDLLGDEGRALLESAIRREEALHPDRIHAEVVYMPRTPRLANLAIRPLARRYEISAGLCPQSDGATGIPLDELVVGVRGNRFYLRWPAAGKDIMVCAGHVLTQATAPTLCRFIAEMAGSGLAQIGGFSWGQAENFPFLPRVQAGRIVLRLAQWRIDARTRAADLRCDSASSFGHAVKTWRAHWQVPRQVYLSMEIHGDNRLLLDLDDPWQMEELREAVQQLTDDGELFLQEVFPSLDHAWTEGAGGHYMAELGVPLVLRTASPAPAQAQRAGAAMRLDSPVPPALRLKPPGSEWLYLKLYCGHELGDDLIAGPIRSFGKKVLRAGLAKAWFFLRYSDPEAHLRIRFRGDAEQLLQALMPEVCRWAAGLMAQGLCLRFCFDSYDREIERYGGLEGIVAAEDFFAADSRAVVELLALLREQRTLHLDRTVLAVLTTDHLLASLGLDPAQRLEWYKSRSLSRREGGSDYRERKTILRSLLGAPSLHQAELIGEGVASALRARAAALAPIGKQLLLLETQQCLCTPLPEIYSAYVHMHLNRLMVPDRLFEPRILALLRRVRLGLVNAPLAGSRE